MNKITFKSSSTSYVPSFKLQGNRTPNYEQQPTIKSPVHYMTGPRAELFRELIKRKIVNEWGILQKKISLPSLSNDEIEYIKSEIFNKFKINLSINEVIEISMGEIMNLFQKKTKECKTFDILNTEINGGFVFFLLFKKEFKEKSYVQRVFESLEIGDLYEKYAEKIFIKSTKKPADIDCRMEIRKKGYPTILTENDLFSMKSLIVNEIALQHFKTINKKIFNKKPICNYVQSNGFTAPGTVHDYPNVFQLVAFKESTIDWVIYRILEIRCVFSQDALYLPISKLLKNDLSSLVPLCYHGEGAQTFIYCMLGFVQSYEINKINHKGWPRLLSWYTKGFCSLPSQETPCMEFQLFLNLKNALQVQGHYLINKELSKWLEKHDLENNPLFRLCFILNAATCLDKRIDDFEIYNLVRKQLNKLEFDQSGKAGKMASLLKCLLVEKQIPISVITDFIQIAALNNHLRGHSPESFDEIAVTIGTNEGYGPNIQINIAGSFWQMPCKLIEAIEHLALFQNEHQFNWQAAQHELAQLFLLVCPPSKTNGPLQKNLLHNLDLLPNQFYEKQLDLIRSSSPLLRYIAIDYLCGLNDNTQVIKGVQYLFICRHAFNVISFIQGIDLECAKQIKEKMELVIGQETIPLGTEEICKPQWLRTLFTLDPNSACEVCAEMIQNEKSIDFILNLFYHLTEHSPQHAHRLLIQLAHSKRFKSEPKIALELLCSCMSILSIQTLSSESLLLLDFLSKELASLLQEKEMTLNLEAVKKIGLEKLMNIFDKLEESKNFSLLIHFAEHCLKHEGFHLPALIKKANLSLQLYANDPEQLKTYINNTSCAALFFPLLHYLNTTESEVDPLLLKHFFKCCKECRKAIFKKNKETLALFLTKSKIPLNIKLDVIALLSSRGASYFAAIEPTLETFFYSLDKKEYIEAFKFVLNTPSFAVQENYPQILSSIIAGYALLTQPENKSEMMILQEETSLLAKILIMNAHKPLQLEPKMLQFLFHRVNNFASDKLQELYLVFEKNNIISFKSHPQNFQHITSIAFCNLRKTNSPNILEFVKKSKDLKLIYHEIKEPDDAIFGLAALICGAAQHCGLLSTKDIERMKWTISKFNTALEMACSNNYKTIKKKDEYEKMKTLVYLAYCQLLVTSNKSQLIREGREFFKIHFMQSPLIPPQVQLNSLLSGLINAFCTIDTLDELQYLLILTNIDSFPNEIVKCRVFEFLQKFTLNPARAKLLLKLFPKLPEQSRDWAAIYGLLKSSMLIFNNELDILIGQTFSSAILLIKKDLKTQKTSPSFNELMELIALYVNKSSNSFNFLTAMAFTTSADPVFFNSLSLGIVRNKAISNELKILFINKMLEAIFPDRERNININLWKQAAECIKLLEKSVDKQIIQQLRELHQLAFKKMAVQQK